MKNRSCPFCGSGRLQTRRAIAVSWFHYVECGKCGAQGPLSFDTTGGKKMSADAVADLEFEAECRWNARN